MLEQLAEIEESSGRLAGMPVTEIAERLESAADPVAAFAIEGFSPSDVVWSLASLALGSGGPGLVQQPPLRPRLERALNTNSLASAFPAASPLLVRSLSAGLLQILDFWDASHTAAQEADDLGEHDFAPYWHGIAHRREPDAGNAAYWFRRVGRHRLFPLLAQAADERIDPADRPDWWGRVVKSGMWDPMAFIDACERVKPATADEKSARQLQRLEMALLLEATLAAAQG